VAPLKRSRRAGIGTTTRRARTTLVNRRFSAMLGVRARELWSGARNAFDVVRSRTTVRDCSQVCRVRTVHSHVGDEGVPHRQIAEWLNARHDATPNGSGACCRRLRHVKRRSSPAIRTRNRAEVERFIRRADGDGMIVRRPSSVARVCRGNRVRRCTTIRNLGINPVRPETPRGRRI